MLSAGSSHVVYAIGFALWPHGFAAESLKMKGTKDAGGES